MAYNPGQERDKQGRWTDTGESGDTSSKVMNHLTKLAPGVNAAPQQLANDPDLDKILRQGSLMQGKGKLFARGVDGRCHWNTAELYKDKEIDSICIGIAHSPRNGGGWYQHTWGLKGGKVVETTVSNNDSDKYFGVVLSKQQATKFVKNLTSAKYAPGNGMVRTKQGGGYM